MDSPNPSSVTTTVPADSIISSLLSFPNSSPISISSSFDQTLDKALASVSGDDTSSVHDRLVNRTLELASLLLDSTKRCFRKRATVHNSKSWFLPPELTIKVFSMLDTKSLMQIAACCSMFYKSAMDRLSYSHIDLTTSAKNVDDAIVCIMIHRGGKELRSLKVGALARPAGSDLLATSLLTRACLSPLSYNHGFLGSRLRSLQLYNLRPMELGVACCKNSSLKTLILRNCPSLEEKEVLRFCNSLRTGDLKSIRHIDVSSRCGLASVGRKGSSKPNFPLEKLKEERPGITFVVDFPITSSEKRFRVCDEMDEEELRLIEMIEAKNDGVHEDYSDEDENEEDDSKESEYLL